MIQKIRSYLLDNKENKDSIGWYVVIIMIAPLLGIFFQYTKSKKENVACVNGVVVDKAIFQLKLYEQKNLIENVLNLLGNEKGASFLSMIFQGKSPEQFILLEEIRKALLIGLFKKEISKYFVSGNKILFDMSNNSIKLKQIVGDLFYKLLSGDNKDIASIAGSVDMKKIDEYAYNSYQAILMNDLLKAPISAIERIIHFDFLLPSEIFFTVYECDFSKDSYFYKKIANEQIITEDELRNSYDKGIKLGLYNKDEEVKCSIFKYRNKKGKEANSKLSKKDIDIAITKKWEVFSQDLVGEEDFKRALDKNFSFFEVLDEVSISLVADKKVASVVLPLPVIEKIILKENDFFVLVEDEIVYFVKNIERQKVEALSYEKAKPKVKERLILERVNDVMSEEITSFRYKLEEDSNVVPENFWIKKERKFSYLSADLDSEKNVKNDFKEFVLKKLSLGILREKASFVEIENEKFVIYFVKKILKEEKSSFSSLRKDKGLGISLFVENLLRIANIDSSLDEVNT